MSRKRFLRLRTPTRRPVPSSTARCRTPAARIRSRLCAPDWLCAVGQGAIAIEARTDDAAAAAWVAEALAFGNEQRMQAVAGEGYRRDYYEFFSPRARAELGPVWIQGYGVGPTGELLFKVALQRVPPKYARVLRVAPAAAERLTLTRDWSGSLVLANEPWLLQSAVVRMQVTAQGVQLAGIDFPGGERLLVGIPGETD